MEKKQSSVDLILNAFNLLSDADFKAWMLNNYDEIKAMHKEEVKESYRQGRTDQQSASDSFYNRNAESYFNETFGGEKQC